MNEWFKGFLELSAAGGTLWAALSARKSAKISAKQLNTQIQQQINAESPRLVPLNSEIDILFKGVHTDWFSSKMPARNFLNYKSFFNTKIINTGKTFALDVFVNFSLEDGTHIFDYHYDDYLSLMLVDQAQANSSDVDDFFVNIIEYQSSNNLVDKDEPIHIEPTQQYFPLIQHAESLDIEIPKYFIILSNVYAMVHKSDTLKKPRLIMKLSYKDEYMKTYDEMFIVELSDITTPNEYGLRINGRLTFTKKAHP